MMMEINGAPSDGFALPGGDFLQVYFEVSLFEI
jgi:hypothetical protein